MQLRLVAVKVGALVINNYLGLCLAEVIHEIVVVNHRVEINLTDVGQIKMAVLVVPLNHY
jgi:hypothetical protein